MCADHDPANVMENKLVTQIKKDLKVKHVGVRHNEICNHTFPTNSDQQR